MRKVPEDGTAVTGFSLQCGQKAFAVAVLIRAGRQPAGLKQGGVEIGAGDHRPGFRAGGDAFRPADQQRLAHAAFLHPALAFGQRCIAGGRALGGRKPAVVGGENHDRVLCHAPGLERIQDLADVVIKVLDHGGIDGVRLDDAALHALVFRMLGGK